MIAGHHTMLKTGISYPWDYRIAYLEVGSGTPYYNMDTIHDMNTDIPSEGVEWSRISDLCLELVVSAKVPSSTSRNQGFGDVTPYDTVLLNKGFRPAGISTWSPNGDNIARDNLYIVADSPVLLRWTPTGYIGFRSDTGQSFPEVYTHGGLETNKSICMLGWYELHSSHLACPVGMRFYRTSGYGVIDGKTFEFDYVPCVYNGTACIYDRVRGIFHYQTGSGTTVPGPVVRDKYDVMDGIGNSRWM